MGIRQSCCRVSKIVMLHQLDFSETKGGKTKWELHNEEMSEVALNKTVIYLRIHRPSK